MFVTWLELYTHIVKSIASCRSLAVAQARIGPQFGVYASHSPLMSWQCDIIVISVTSSSSSSILIADMSHNRQIVRWCTKIDKYKVWVGLISKFQGTWTIRKITSWLGGSKIPPEHSCKQSTSKFPLLKQVLESVMCQLRLGKIRNGWCAQLLGKVKRR